VILRVNSFELQGSEGSPKFGQPVYVEDSESVRTSLYCMAVASPSPTSTVDRVSLSPVLSQTGSINNDMSPLDNSAMEATFCTQVPRSLRESPSLNLAERTDIRYAITQSTDTIPKHKSAATAKPQNTGVHLQLIALLPPHRRPHEALPSSSGSAVPAIHQKFELINVNGEPKGYDHGYPPGAKRRKSNTPSEPIVEECLRDIRCTTQPLQNSSAQQSDDCKSISLKDLSNENTSSMMESNRQNHKESQVSPVAKISPPPLVGEPSESAQELEIDRAPWDGLSRVPRSFVQIPKDQQALLASNESWLHPESGERKDCVPAKIIQQLDAFYEYKHSSKSESVQDEASSEDSAKDTSEEAETSSEIGSEDGILNIAKDIDNSTSVALSPQSQSSPRQSESDGSGDETISWSRSPDRGAGPLETQFDNSTTIHSEELGPKTPRLSPGLPSRQSPQTGAPISDPFLDGTLARSPLSLPSSQVEMELVVPGALEDQASTLGDHIMISGTNQQIPSTAHRSQRPVQVERTPNTTSKRAKSPLPKNWVSQENRLSSDPIIPGTLDNNAFHSSNPVANSMTAKTQPSSSVGEVDPPIYTTGSSIVEVHTGGQLHGELELFPQRPTSIESVSSSFSPSRRRKQVGESLCEYKGYGEIHSPTEAATTSHFTRSKVSPVKDNSHRNTPVSSIVRTSQDQETVIVAQVPSTSPVPQTRQLKRIVTTNVFETTSKRRRSNTFSLSQEQDVMIDPKEIAKANRKNFLRNLSPNDDDAVVEHDSPPIPTQGPAKNDIVRQPNPKSSNTNPNRPPFNEASRSQAKSPKLTSPPLLQNHPSTRRKLDSSLDDPGTSTEANIQQINGTQECISVETNPSEVGPEVQTFPVTAPDHVHPSSNNTPEILNVFERFKITYPSYKANQKNFIRVCVYIEWLKASHKLHPTLWDDFIRAFSEDYSGYVKQCMHTGQHPIPGLQFYNEYVSEPRFTNRLITTTTLSEALYLDPKLTAKYREAFEKKAQTQNDLFSVASTPLTSVDEILTGGHSTTQASAESPQNLERVPTATGNGDNSKTIEAASSDSEGAHRKVSVSNFQSMKRRPFFETPSQKIPFGDIGRNLADTEQGAEALCLDICEPQDVEMLSVDTSSLTCSILPQSLQPHKASTPASVSETCLERHLPKVIKSANSRWKSVGRRKTEQDPKPALCDGSPILGRQTPECTVGVSPTFIAIPSPTPNRANQEEHSLKTFPFSSNTLKRKNINMPSPGPDRTESQGDNQRESSPPTKKLRHPLSSMPRLSFGQLAKAYVTRRKRMGGAFAIQSELTSISSSTLSRMPAKK
jgi:hypothetical protein